MLSQLLHLLQLLHARLFAMQAEVCSYRLNYRGKPIGSQTLSTYHQGRFAFLETKLMMQGPLGTANITQKSKLNRQFFESLSFSEETQEQGSKRNFQLVFDRESGLIQASKGSDKSSVPLIRPMLDPLALLYRIRYLKDKTHLRVPMLGKDVVVEHLMDTTLETNLGEKEASVYHVRPGENLVYIDKASPHLILMMTQRLEGQSVDAQIVKLSHEALKQNNPRSNRRSKRKSRRRKPPRQKP